MMAYLGIIGLAYALSVFGINFRLKKPFSCELCLTFWICFIIFVAAIWDIDILTYFNYFIPLFIVKIINIINSILWQRRN